MFTFVTIAYAIDTIFNILNNWFIYKNDLEKNVLRYSLRLYFVVFFYIKCFFSGGGGCLYRCGGVCVFVCGVCNLVLGLIYNFIFCFYLKYEKKVIILP